MKGDETPIAYLSHAQEYSTAFAKTDEPVKDKDIVMLAISKLKKNTMALSLVVLPNTLLLLLMNYTTFSVITKFSSTSLKPLSMF